MTSDPSPTAKTRLLSFNRTQSRVVTGLLVGHKTLRRNLHLMSLTNIPLCGAQEECSAHILCECEALASLRHEYLGSSFLDPEGIKSLDLGTNWNFSKRAGLPWLGIRLCGTKGPFVRSRYIGTAKARTQLFINRHSRGKNGNPLQCVILRKISFSTCIRQTVECSRESPKIRHGCRQVRP